MHPDALLIDVGSTTADIVPIADGRVAATGHNDLERLLAGELVYTGVLRTNLAAIAPRVPVPGGWCPVSSEYFAISADVHLVLGHLAPDAYDCPTPDGRAATAAFARERIARLVCSDVEQLDAAEIDAIAAYLHGEQLRALEEAARRVQRTLAARRARRPGRLGRLPRARGRRAPRAGGRRRAVERDRRRDGARRGARGAPGGAPVLTVVKVGGGLGRGAGDDALRALCATLGELGERHPLLVVPGGAWFADAVREADRRFAPARHDLAPHGGPRHGAVRLAAERADPGRRALRRARAAAAGRTTVLLPAALALDGLPASWQVTSDSIAAWVAGRAGAGRLVLVKEVDGLFAQWPAHGEPIARMTAAELGALRPAGVDEHLPAVLERASFETWVISGRDPERLVELLERGATVGTRIA